MSTEDKNKHEDEKIDLKHDTMEFAASTDGDDILDKDTIDFEEDDISSEELDVIEGAPDDEEAAALNVMERERVVDVDNLPEEDWTDDLHLDDDTKEDKADEHREEDK